MAIWVQLFTTVARQQSWPPFSQAKMVNSVRLCLLLYPAAFSGNLSLYITDGMCLLSQPMVINAQAAVVIYETTPHAKEKAEPQSDWSQMQILPVTIQVNSCAVLLISLIKYW